MKHRAGELRRNQTSAERALWARLRMRNLCDVRFLRQRVMGNYIVDFMRHCCAWRSSWTVGSITRQMVSATTPLRTEWLQACGITVLRYTNLDVSRRLGDVLCDIDRMVAQLKQHPPAPAARPPSFRRG